MKNTIILVVMIVVCTIIALFTTVLLISKATCSECPPPPKCPEIPEWAAKMVPLKEKGGVVLRPEGSFSNMNSGIYTDTYIKHFDNLYLKPGNEIDINNSYVERAKIGCVFPKNRSGQCVCSCNTPTSKPPVSK